MIGCRQFCALQQCRGRNYSSKCGRFPVRYEQQWQAAVAESPDERHMYERVSCVWKGKHHHHHHHHNHSCRSKWGWTCAALGLALCPTLCDRSIMTGIKISSQKLENFISAVRIDWTTFPNFRLITHRTPLSDVSLVCATFGLEFSSLLSSSPANGVPMASDIGLKGPRKNGPKTKHHASILK